MSRTAKIKAVELDAKIAKRDGSTYDGIELTLEFGPNELRTKGIHSSVIANNPTLEGKLKQVAAGEVPNAAVVMEKNAKGFLDVIDVISDATAGTATAASGGGFRATPTKSFDKGNSTQTTIRIARQNALAAAVQVAKTPEEALKVATAFADFLLAPEGLDEATVSETVEADTVEVETPF